MFSCYENKEGCLDIKATNFDFDADEDCCDEEACCCEYPSLTLDIAHKETRDSIDNFTLGKRYDWPVGDGLFIVESVQFYLSKFELHGIEPLYIRDSINVSLVTTSGIEENIFLEDNFVLVRPGVFSYNIGEIQGSGSYDSLSMQYGVYAPANNALVESLPEDHPLGIQNPIMQFNPIQGYINCQVILKKDTFADTINDTINIFRTEHVGFNFQPPQIVENGQNKLLKLRINYLEWFQGIDFALDNNDKLTSKMSNNLTSSLEYNE